MKKLLIIHMVCLGFLSSCFLKEPDRHDGFESISHCYVYEYEVESDWHLFGTVEYIDTSHASECIKTQLRNTYFLNLKDSKIPVYGDHPKNNIDEIKKQHQKHSTDTTRLKDFVKHADGYSITIERLCKDTSHFRNNTFVDWKLIIYGQDNSRWKKTEEKILTFWYDWSK